MAAALRRGGLDPAHLLGLCRHGWSAGFTEAVMAWLAGLFAPGGPLHGEGSGRHAPGLEHIAPHADPSAAAGPLAALLDSLPESVRPGRRDALERLAETLRFRAAMQKELAP